MPIIQIGNASFTPSCSWCYSAQPAWSAYREVSFGGGLLTILNDTAAKWECLRNVDNMPVADGTVSLPLVVRDSVYIYRKHMP